VTSTSLGETWVKLVEHIVREGTPMSNEGLEVLGASVFFRISSATDEVLDRFADQKMIAEMKKVFFEEGRNSLGHSYAKLLSGPDGRHDLQDVISLLRAEPHTKRALVSFLSVPGGKVPCISAVQFLVRNGALHLIYFARGQDAYKKFYADGLCLIAMAETVAKSLGVHAGTAQGLIGSSHVYHLDMPAIRDLLEQAGNRSASNSRQPAVS
jgi:thymidylate synthase